MVDGRHPHDYSPLMTEQEFKLVNERSNPIDDNIFSFPDRGMMKLF